MIDAGAKEEVMVRAIFSTGAFNPDFAVDVVARRRKP